MQKADIQKDIKKWAWIATIVILCLISAFLDFVEITYTKDAFRNRMISKILQQACGATAGIFIVLRLKLKIFQKPQNLLYMIPCLMIAVDNFQFSAYFSGKMTLVRTNSLDLALFAANCLFVGLFEEIIFRGIVFSVLASTFSKDRVGLLKTYVASSLVFGLAHIFNGFSFGILVQVVYTILTGGLFCFCFLKTKNILCCAFVHAVYNFCGLLFDKQGLGTGVVFDLGTVITMVIVCVSVGAFILYKVWKYPEEERKELYFRLGI